MTKRTSRAARKAALRFGNSARRRTGLAAAALALLLVAPQGLWAQGAGARVAALNARLTQLLAQLPQAAPAQAAELRRQGGLLLAEREAELSSLIAANPAEALAQALPAEKLAEIAAALPEAAQRLESRGIWHGTLELWIEDHATRTSSRQHLRLHTSPEDPSAVVELHFTGRAPASLRTGSVVKAQGMRAGRRAAVQRASVAPAASGAAFRALSADSPPDAALGACSLTGAQPVVAIRVNFTSFTLPAAVTQDMVRGSLMGNAFAPTSQSATDWSLDGLWKDTSDGQTSVDTATSTVVGPFTLAGNFNAGGNCDLTGIQNAAIAAADGMVNFQNFTRIVIVHPNNNACTYSGTATMGCQALSSAGDGNFTASTAWVSGNFITNREEGVETLAHVAGHNLGLGDADTRDYGPEPLGGLPEPGIVDDLGDLYSAMGQAGLGLYSAKHAATELGWLAPTTNYLTVETSGSHTIQNYERRPAGVKALKVRRGAGNNAWLWVEYRQNTGLYDSTLPAQVWNGVMIHYEDAGTGIRTELLDYFQPALNVWTDVALPSGSSWTDPYTGTVIAVSNATATSIDVNVSYVTNDNFANAVQVVDFQSAFSFSSAAFTTEANDPTPTCGNGSKGKSAWFTFTPDQTGTAIVDTFGSSYDTILSAWTGSPGAFVFTACNDNTGGPQSRISFAVTAGTAYWVMVTATNNDGGTLVVNISLPSGADNIANAVLITSSPFSSTTNTTGFTTAGSDPTPSCGLGARGKSAWYKFTPPFAGSATVNTIGSNYDTVLAAYTGSPGALTEVDCNDDFEGNFTSGVALSVAAGVTYYIMVSAFENNGGSLTLNATIPFTARRRGGLLISE